MPIVFLADSLSLINLGYEIVILSVEDILLYDSEFILVIFTSIDRELFDEYWVNFHIR